VLYFFDYKELTVPGMSDSTRDRSYIRIHQFNHWNNSQLYFGVSEITFEKPCWFIFLFFEKFAIYSKGVGISNLEN